MRPTQTHRWKGTAPQRVLSIDVLRGLTIALMILVNDPGDWAHVYPQLDHAEWNGFTLTDLVFPNFLFLVGASVILSIESRLSRGESRTSLSLHMLRRAATLFAIKMLLTAFPHFHWTHLRLYGVLTRIAVCYLVAGLICLVTRRARTLSAITVALLIGYWALMRFVPVPGYGVPTHGFPMLDPDRNLAAWLDRGINAFTQRTIHTGSLYNHTRDPEGMLSTLPAIATTLIGSITALWLRRVDPRGTEPSVSTLAGAQESSSRPGRSTVEERPHLVPAAATISRNRCFYGLLIAGILAQIAGLFWSHTFPINKNLWTSSYVLFAAGLSLVLLALCYWLVDIRALNQTPAGKWLLWPWLVFGSNAIFAFVFSNLVVEIMLWIKVPAGVIVNPAAPSTPISAWHWTYRHIFARHDSTDVASLAFALAFTAICLLPNLILWRRRIFPRI